MIAFPAYAILIHSSNLIASLGSHGPEDILDNRSPTAATTTASQIAAEMGFSSDQDAMRPSTGAETTKVRKPA